MNNGFTQTEAQALVGELFETHAPFYGVPRRTRGSVIEAYDAGDHWNVMIEWHLPGKPVQGWFTKFELQNYMQRVQ